MQTTMKAPKLFDLSEANELGVSLLRGRRSPEEEPATEHDGHGTDGPDHSANSRRFLSWNCTLTILTLSTFVFYTISPISFAPAESSVLLKERSSFSTMPDARGNDNDMNNGSNENSSKKGNIQIASAPSLKTVRGSSDSERGRQREDYERYWYMETGEGKGEDEDYDEDDYDEGDEEYDDDDYDDDDYDKEDDYVGYSSDSQGDLQREDYERDRYMEDEEGDVYVPGEEEDYGGQGGGGGRGDLWEGWGNGENEESDSNDRGTYRHDIDVEKNGDLVRNMGHIFDSDSRDYQHDVEDDEGEGSDSDQGSQQYGDEGDYDEDDYDEDYDDEDYDDEDYDEEDYDDEDYDAGDYDDEDNEEGPYGQGGAGGGDYDDEDDEEGSYGQGGAGGGEYLWNGWVDGENEESDDESGSNNMGTYQHGFDLEKNGDLMQNMGRMFDGDSGHYQHADEDDEDGDSDQGKERYGDENSYDN